MYMKWLKLWGHRCYSKTVWERCSSCWPGEQNLSLQQDHMPG